MPFDVDRTIRTANGWRFAGLRRGVIVAAAAQIGLWFYLWVFIAQHSNPRGDGLEWAAIVPATGLLALFVARALVIGLIDRLLIVGAFFAAVGAVLNILLFVEIVRELVH